MIQLEIPGVSGVGTLRYALNHLLSNALECSTWTRKMHATHARFLLDWFGDVPLGSIGYPLIQRYYLDEQKRGMARETIRKRLSTLHMTFAEAVRQDWVEKIPPWVVIKTDTRPKEAYWSLVQWEAAHLACDDEDLRTWIACGFWTGMHTSDLNRFRWDDVDLARRTWVRRNTKSKAKPLALPLPERFWQVLSQRHADLQPHQRDFVAGRNMGHPNRPMRAVCLRADVPLIGPIGLRHSCETFLAQCETTELFQTTWMGLKSPKMLHKHYRHVTTPTLDGGIAAMNAGK